MKINLLKFSRVNAFRNIFVAVLFVMLFASAVNIQTVNAALEDEVGRQLTEAGSGAGYAPSDAKDPRLIVANIIKVALEFLGMIFFALTIYAGFLWMTAGGNSEQVDKAKSLLTQAVIGLTIVLSAYSITQLAIRFAKGDYTDYYDSRTRREDFDKAPICGPGTTPIGSNSDGNAVFLGGGQSCSDASVDLR